MKVETKEKAQFPCLMVTKDPYKVVVLFSSECTGTVISSEKDTYDVGFYDASWIMSKFEIFNGSVNLSN